MRSKPERKRRRSSRKRKYGASVEDVVRVVDRALDHPCRERLTPILPEVADRLQAHGRITFSAETRELLQTISTSTVGRILRRLRQDDPRLPRREHATSINRIQAQIPISNIRWDVTTPGHFEVDLVFHSGPSISGDHVYTLHMVDVATGWSELTAFLGRSYRVVQDGFLRCLARIPFPVLEIHTDNGSEFLNAHMLQFWQDSYKGIALSRTRPYHSQDNRFVEHRNGALVRALVGHDRLDTVSQTNQLNRVYDTVWSYFNFFQPVMRQTEKLVVNGHTRRKHKDIRTPLQRVLQSGVLKDDCHSHLNDLYLSSDPLALLLQINTGLKNLFQLPNATPDHTEDIFETLAFEPDTRKEEVLLR
jgi:transposase InsO family protein